ncbi:MAG: hypothetical protein KJ573_15315 [Proteobacteria bacterium]|nr:hypothetical protein [Pseudomonadota bacterium]
MKKLNPDNVSAITDQEERLLAHGTATMMVLPSLQIKGQSELPPKFLKIHSERIPRRLQRG